MTDAERLLDRVKAVKVRDGVHQVWRLPNGNLVTMSATASDHRAVKNQVALIERLMGWRSKTASVGKPRTPKRRHRRNTPSPWASSAVGIKLRDFHEQMRELFAREDCP